MRFMTVSGECREHVEYTVERGANMWVARNKKGRIIARDYISEASLRRTCDSMTDLV